MKTIELAQLANQSFTITLDGVRYGIRIVETEGVMCADIDRAGVRVISGTRCLAGVPLIPYIDLEDGSGNFIFLTESDDLPYWDQFGATQTLVYASGAELDALFP